MAKRRSYQQSDRYDYSAPVDPIEEPLAEEPLAEAPIEEPLAEAPEPIEEPLAEEPIEEPAVYGPVELTPAAVRREGGSGSAVVVTRTPITYTNVLGNERSVLDGVRVTDIPYDVALDASRRGLVDFELADG